MKLLFPSHDPEALSNEEDYPEGLYIALHGEGMLDSQMIENEINAVSGRE